jgi:hypothetical protein
MRGCHQLVQPESWVQGMPESEASRPVACLQRRRRSILRRKILPAVSSRTNNGVVPAYVDVQRLDLAILHFFGVFLDEDLTHHGTET